MGWFSSPTKESTSKSADGGTIAPDRSKRERCYESRDLFFDCLDENNILDAIKYDGEARAKCPKEVEVYERDCARSWIKYFKEKRVMEYNRDRTIDNIKKEDATKVAELKAQREQKGRGWFGS